MNVFPLSQPTNTISGVDVKYHSCSPEHFSILLITEYNFATMSLNPGKENNPNLQPAQQDPPPVYIQHGVSVPVSTPGSRYTPQVAMVPVTVVPAAVVGAQYQSESASRVFGVFASAYRLTY
jgi:hypothetical protein